MAGIGVLAALLGFCALLVEPYYLNWRLQRYLETAAFDPNRISQPREAVVADVVNHASQLGLPVQADAVRITQSEGALFIELRYFIRVDLKLYEVTLHFRPSAGSR